MRMCVVWALALCLPQVAAAHTIEGELRVQGDAVDVVARTNTYRLIGRTDGEKARIADLRRYLDGEQVTLEGKLFMSERGPYLVPADLVSPVRTEIAASGSGDGWRRQLSWRGENVPASGLDAEVPAEGARLDVYLFRGDGIQVGRIHVVGIWARYLDGVSTKTLKLVRKTGWIREVEHTRHVAWVPFPPGNPTTFWDFTTDMVRFDLGQGRELNVVGAVVTIPAAEADSEAYLLGATEVPEGQGIEDVLRQR